jgi:3-oxoacyl-[acyl-carrier-protein] synthase II
MGAASDLGEVILSVMAAGEGVVPATPGFSAPDPAYAKLQVSGQRQRCAAPRFLSASYGLGGQSSAVVVATPPGSLTGA